MCVDTIFWNAQSSSGKHDRGIIFVCARATVLISFSLHVLSIHALHCISCMVSRLPFLNKHELSLCTVQCTRTVHNNTTLTPHGHQVFLLYFLLLARYVPNVAKRSI